MSDGNVWVASMVGLAVVAYAAAGPAGSWETKERETMEKAQVEKKEAKPKGPPAAKKEAPTLGRIIHVREGEKWEAGIVTDEGARFVVHVLGKHARVLSLQVNAEGRSWRWPPR